MALSALEDKSAVPTPAELGGVLGGAEAHWQHLVSLMQARYGPLSEEWSLRERSTGGAFGS